MRRSIFFQGMVCWPTTGEVNYSLGALSNETRLLLMFDTKSSQWQAFFGYPMFYLKRINFCAGEEIDAYTIHTVLAKGAFDWPYTYNDDYS